eukprot:gene100-4349_t
MPSKCKESYELLPPPKSITIGKSKIPNSGLGVFANEFIKKGTIVEHCPLLFLKRENILKDSLLWKYLFKPTFQNSSIYSTLALGHCSVYNHHDRKVNLHHFQDCDRMMKIVATKDIRKGQELYLDYGESYWKFHDSQKELLLIAN